MTSWSLACNWSELLGCVIYFQNHFESLLRKRNLDGDFVYCRDNPKVSEKGSAVILLSHSPNLSKWLAGFIALDAWDTWLWLVRVSGEVIAEPRVARSSIITSQGETGRVKLYCTGGRLFSGWPLWLRAVSKSVQEFKAHTVTHTHAPRHTHKLHATHIVVASGSCSGRNLFAAKLHCLCYAWQLCLLQIQ